MLSEISQTEKHKYCMISLVLQKLKNKINQTHRYRIDQWVPEGRKVEVGKVVSKGANFQGFPGGAVVKNLPANAGDAGSSPGLGRSHIPLPAEQLSPGTTTTEPALWARMPQLLKSAPRALQQEKPPQCKAHASQGRVLPLTATRESPRKATKAQCSHK